MKNAGFEIIKSEFYNENYAIVIGKKTTQFGTEYVTWDSKPNENSFFWGHYFTDEKRAMVDYHLRLITYYEAQQQY